jgi:hypothetical protein
VSLSADGDTALVGAPRDGEEVGAAWVFTRTGTTWTQQGPKLTGAGESGEGHFGRSVALSPDGDTALVGAPNDSAGLGAVWVFTRSGATWTEQAKLAGGGEEVGKAWFGRSVALSADGSTALVGGYVDHGEVGAAWVFTRSGSTWTQQGAKLTGGEELGAGEFGWGVALSADGATALIGGRGDDGGAGAVWVFTRSGSTWMQQGAKLTGTEEDFDPGDAGSEEIDEEVGNGYFGDSVSLSADGATALIGGPRDNGWAGAAWVFARSGSTWTQQGAKLTGGEEGSEGYFGDSVALSGDSATALIGGLKDGNGIGAAWLFARAGSTWTQQGAKLTGGEELGKGQFGWGVALSGDGATALVGGLGDHAKAGAAWVFGDPPPEPPTSSQPETPSTTPAKQSTASQPATTPPPTAKSGVQAASAAAGRVTLAGMTVTVRANGRAAVRLRCIAVLPCKGRLTITATTKGPGPNGRPRRVTLGTAAFSIPPGRTTTVKVRLSSAGRALLSAHRGRLTVKLAIRKLSPGTPRTRTYTARLVLRTAPRVPR